MTTKAIQAKIDQKGITKTHLAKMLGIDPATISRILSGKQPHTSSDLLEKIAYYLDALNTDDENILKKRSN
jgi:transcriptional regulator with XRE-family HTH domain